MKLTVLQGYPTKENEKKSKELVFDKGNTYRVNFRLVSKMLNFSKRNKSNDTVTRDAMELVVADLLLKEKNVIIDSVSLTEKEVQKWEWVAEHFGTEFEVLVYKK